MIAYREGTLNATEARELFERGYSKDELVLAGKAKLIAEFLRRADTDPNLLEGIEYAIRVLETEERAYTWLTRSHALLQGMTPVEALLAGNAEHVLRILNNIEYGLPV